MGGFYSKYCAARATSVKSKWSYPDPTGVDEPLKISLEGRCGATDAEVCALIRGQEEEVKAKQTEGKTETGGEGRNTYGFDKETLALTIEERKELLKAVEENRLEAFLESVSEAREREEEKNEAAKRKAADAVDGKKPAKKRGATTAAAPAVPVAEPQVNGHQS